MVKKKRELMNATQKSILLPGSTVFALGLLLGTPGFAVGAVLTPIIAPIIYWKNAPKEKSKTARIGFAFLLSGAGFITSMMTGAIGAGINDSYNGNKSGASNIGEVKEQPKEKYRAEKKEAANKQDWCAKNQELGKYDYTSGIAAKFADIAARAGVTPADPNTGRPWPPRPIIEAEVKKYPLLWTEWKKLEKEQSEAEALQDRYRKECRDN